MRVADEELAGAGPPLRDDRGRGDRPDSRDRDQQLSLPGERDHHLLHVRIQPVDHLITLVDVFQMQLTHQEATEPSRCSSEVRAPTIFLRYRVISRTALISALG